MSQINQIAAVAASTGTQGRSVVKALSQAGYHVRALTRQPDSAEAKAHFSGLKNVSLTRCDINDLASVRDALDGAHILYALSIADMAVMTAAPGADVKSTGLSEAEQGMRYADVAKEKNVRCMIWATLPDAANISKNTYSNMGHFQEKVLAQKYIQELKIPAFFVCPTMFMENMTEFGTITKTQDGNLQLNLPHANVTDSPCYPMLYVEADLGRLVALLVKNFDKVQGKTIKAFDRCYSGMEMVQIIQKATGKTVKFETKSCEGSGGSDLDEMFSYFADSRYPFYEDGDEQDDVVKQLGFTFTPFDKFVKDKVVAKFA